MNGLDDENNRNLTNKRQSENGCLSKSYNELERTYL